MNKAAMTEAEICQHFITPAIVKAGWDKQTQVRLEYGFTAGRALVRGKLASRGKRRRTDYLLFYGPNLPIAVICGKGMKHRKLPLKGELGDFFASLPSDGDYVFGFERGRKKGLGFKDFPQHRWEEVCKAAEVPTAPYDLRHTFITEMIADGATFEKVAKWCGNSQRVIEERYSHLSPAHLSDIADRVGKVKGRHPAPSSNVLKA